MIKVVTFGETMGQYNPMYKGPFDPKRKDHLLDFAGAESNFAVGLQRLGIQGLESVWVSRLGDDNIGDFILRALSDNHITVIADKCDGESTGKSYVTHPERGEPTKEYERKESAASRLTFSDVKPHIQDADLLHVTGITPALSDTCRETIFEALRYAEDNVIPVSFDLNYREPLWTPEKAKPVMEEMLSYSSIFKTGYREAEAVWGYGLSPIEYAKSFQQLSGGIVIVTRGENGAALYDGQNLIEHPGYKVEVVDPIGAGDAFMAGFVGVLLSRCTIEQFFSLKESSLKESSRRDILDECVKTANVCGALACTGKGDTAAMPTMQQVKEFLETRKN